ncbi:hypothetical protein JCM3770_000660 [Rhodotorula araucariae]
MPPSTRQLLRPSVLVLKPARALEKGPADVAGWRNAVRQGAGDYRAGTLLATLFAGTVSGGALFMQDRDPLESSDRPSPPRSHRLSFASSRSQWSALHPRLSADTYTTTAASADDIFEDAEEPLDACPAVHRRSVSSRGGPSPLEVIPDRSPDRAPRRRHGTPQCALQPTIRYEYVRDDPDRTTVGGLELAKQGEASLADEHRGGTTVSSVPQYFLAWQGEQTLKAPSPRAVLLPDVNSLDITLEVPTFNGASAASSYSPSGSFPSILKLHEVSDAPVEPLFSPPTPPTDLAATPALSCAPSASPALSIPYTPTFFDSDGSPNAMVASPTASPVGSPAVTPSLRPPPSPGALSLVRPPLTRGASVETMTNRLSSSGISSSKSARRLSTILTSGFGFGRSRTSASLSTDTGEPSPAPREPRRRPRTSDGSAPRSAPLLSVPSFPFPTQPPSPQPLPSHSPSPSRRSRSPNPSSLIRSPTDGRTWRSTFSPETFQRMSLKYGTSEMRRQEVIFELCETERAFVAGLRGVVDLFAMPLRTCSGAWIKNVPPPVSRLFEWLDDIVRLHAELSAALDAAQDVQDAVVLRIADAFAPFVQRFEVHQPYLVRFDVVSALINELAAGRVPAQWHDHRGPVHVHLHGHGAGTLELGSFGEFVRMQSRRPECGGLSLASFLLKPIQRLMKYPLFFLQLCELTPAGHPDHAATHALHRSTDAMILALQEVKAREDEYDTLKVLAARTRGLPEGFRLARRDRRVQLQGPLRQVHLSERDRAALDAVVAAAPDPRRPVSTASDSGSSLASAGTGSLTWGGGSDSSSAGWTTPATPGSLSGPSSPPPWTRALPPPPPGLGPEPPRPPARQQRLRTRAKESAVLAWVFSDVLLIAQPFGGGKWEESPRGVLKSAKVSVREPVRALEGTGVVKVVCVTDISGRTEHDHLVQIDVAPILGKGQPVSSATLRTVSLYFTLPPPTAATSPRASNIAVPAPPGPAREQSAQWAAWLRALAAPLAHHTAQERQQTLSERPQLLNAYDTPITTSEPRSSGLFPAAPARGGSAQEEGEWWAHRLSTVRREMDDAEQARAHDEEVGARAPRREDERARLAAGREKPPRTGFASAELPDGKNAGLGIDSLAFRMKDALVAGVDGRRMSG